MKHEFHAHFDFALQDSTTRAYALDWLVGRTTRLPHRWREIALIKDDYARIEVLAQALATGHKEQARMGSRKSPSGLYYWIKQKSESFLKRRKEFMEEIVRPSLPDLALFPKGSWTLQIKFKLKKPYISKDDADFYILDNPVKKEWVFKVPYVAPSQWKGTLRSAMVRKLVEWWQNLPEEKRDSMEFAKRRLRLALLFGSEKGEEPDAVKGLAKYLDEVGGKEAAREFRKLLRQHFGVPEDKPIPHFRGRLHFYPTFFDRIGLEVINPHNRKTGAGKQPIYLESVPAGTMGILNLLYVPLDLIGKASQEEMENEVKEDLKAVAEGVKAMLTEYGFGAKTSGGYGVAEVINEEVIPRDLKTLL